MYNICITSNIRHVLCKLILTKDQRRADYTREPGGESSSLSKFDAASVNKYEHGYNYYWLQIVFMITTIIIVCDAPSLY